MPLVLGLTGGIAAGKSLVADELARLGARVIDADQLARALVVPGAPVLRQLVAAFGGAILLPDGSLDRARLGAQVFADAGARQRLNAIMHPAIAQLAKERLQAARRTAAPLVVYEAPLLFEAGAAEQVDRVLVVTVDPDVQCARLMRRDGLDQPAARQRIAAQWPQAQKVQRADFTIDTSGSVAAVRTQVRALFKKLTAPPGPGSGETSG